MPTRKLALKEIDFEVAVVDDGTTRTVTPKGEIDSASVGSVRAPLQAAVNNGFEHVVLDLCETSFLDSTGIHLVLTLRAEAGDRGTRFVVLPGPPAVQRVFALCGVGQLVFGGGEEL